MEQMVANSVFAPWALPDLDDVFDYVDRHRQQFIDRLGAPSMPRCRDPR
jgi:hypothetical protein